MEMVVALWSLCHIVILIRLISLVEIINADTTSVCNITFVFNLTVFKDLKLRFNPGKNSLLGFLQPYPLCFLIQLVLKLILLDC